MTEPNPTRRTMCMQVSTTIDRFDDELLGKFFPAHTHELDAVRAELRRLRDGGMDVLPCERHQSDPVTGRCTGEALS